MAPHLVAIAGYCISPVRLGDALLGFHWVKITFEAGFEQEIACLVRLRYASTTKRSSFCCIYIYDELKLASGLRISTKLNGYFHTKKWLALKFLMITPMSTTFHANVSTLTYLTDPLKTLTFALFWPQIPPKTTKIR
jgi:hypothetical protein